jgi:hypothetical protein
MNQNFLFDPDPVKVSEIGRILPDGLSKYSDKTTVFIGYKKSVKSLE